MSKVMSPYDFLRKLILPLDQIDYYIPKKGTIIDLGCGQGVISKFLAKSKSRQIIGIDANAKRLPPLKFKNLKFISADITKYPIKRAQGVILSDVLHHINIKDQKKLINDISKSLKSRGILVIKEIDSGEFVRSKLSRLWDLLLYPSDKINYWQYQDLQKFLEEMGFGIKVLRPCRFFPGSTTLFICKK